jgi:hypothetical protein
MHSSFLPALAACLLLAHGAEAKTNCTLETTTAEPPEELHASVRQLLAKKCMRLKNADGEALFEVWLRAETPVKATREQLENGLTYHEVPASTLLGAVRVVQEASDYRKQKLPAGVYTLRLAVQPVSDDHTGTAPHREFCLLCPAADDKKPDLMSARALQDRSARVTTEHPAVFLLFPGKGATAAAKLVDKGKGHVVLQIALPIKAGGRKAKLPLGLTLLGHSASLDK